MSIVQTTGYGRIDPLARCRAALEMTPARRWLRYQAARDRYNRAVGERCEAAVVLRFEELDLDPVRIPQDRESKATFCPPHGKRPDGVSAVDGRDLVFDVKHHTLQPNRLFALPVWELNLFDGFMTQPGMRPGLPLLIALVPRWEPPVLHLIDIRRLNHRCQIGRKAALGTRLQAGDDFGPIRQELFDQAEMTLIEEGRFKPSDFERPIY